MKDDNESKKGKNFINNWLQLTLIGVVMLLFGLMSVLFPKMLASLGFMVAGVLFMLIGVTDTIAAFKYKTGESGFNGEGVSGILSILLSLFFIATFYMPNITTMTIIYVLCAWGIIRCILMFISVFNGRAKSKGTVLSALISGVAGIALFLLRDIIMSSGKLIGIIMLVLGALCMLIGLYQRADTKGKKEKELAEKHKENESQKAEATQISKQPELATEATEAEVTEIQEVENEK